MATVTWEREHAQPAVFQLHGLETMVGREPGCAVRLDSTYVSKRHAVIRLTQQGYVVADLNSSNGTFVNDQRVSMTLLKDGDRVTIGSETLVFSNPAAGAAPNAGSAFGSGAGAKRRGPMILLMAGGGAVVLLLFLLILAGRSGGTGSSESGSAAPDSGGYVPPAQSASPGSYAAPTGFEAPPLATGTDVPPANVDVPAGVGADALYESAMVHVKGGRLVEARRMLTQAASLDPTNAMILQRLREVEATIQVRADQHLAAGTRAFTYLRYQDAIIEWEQVLAMTDPSDPRYQQATAGIVRAKQKLGQPIR